MQVKYSQHIFFNTNEPSCFATLVDFLSLELNIEKIVVLKILVPEVSFNIWCIVKFVKSEKKKGNKSSLVIFFYNEILDSLIFHMRSKLIEKNLNRADFHRTPSSENLKGENRNPK